MASLVRVDGLKELERKLLAIGLEYGDKATAAPVRAALRAGAVVIQKSAIAKVHKKSGTLAANIIVTSQGKQTPGLISMKVTVRAKAKAYKPGSKNRKLGRAGTTYQDAGPLFYGRFLEFGTKGSAKHHATAAYPFMRPAFEENKESVLPIIRDYLAFAIERTIAKLGK